MKMFFCCYVTNCIYCMGKTMRCLDFKWRFLTSLAREHNLKYFHWPGRIKIARLSASLFLLRLKSMWTRRHFDINDSRSSLSLAASSGFIVRVAHSARFATFFRNFAMIDSETGGVRLWKFIKSDRVSFSSSLFHDRGEFFCRRKNL